MAFDILSYKEVSERLTDLFARHPEASMRGTYEVLALGAETFIAYRAECYRTPDDAAPGIGTAWEQVPGKTPYTKGSELQNAETSAWGRAIVAVGASESKRIASANEMRSAQARQNAPKVSPEPSGSGAGPVSDTTTASGPAVPKHKRDALKARCVALTADGVSVADEREARGLPLVDSCDELAFQAFESMVGELEAELTKPFAESATK